MTKASNMVKIQVPIEADVRDRFEAYVKDLGFDSIQAYIRVWAKAKADGREVDFDDDWGQPSPAAAVRLNRWAEEAMRDSEAGKLKSYKTADEFMRGLHDNKSDTA